MLSFPDGRNDEGRLTFSRFKLLGHRQSRQGTAVSGLDTSNDDDREFVNLGSEWLTNPYDDSVTTVSPENI
jgi:hypothetical protein